MDRDTGAGDYPQRRRTFGSGCPARGQRTAAAPGGGVNAITSRSGRTGDYDPLYDDDTAASKELRLLPVTKKEVRWSHGCGQGRALQVRFEGLAPSRAIVAPVDRGVARTAVRFLVRLPP